MKIKNIPVHSITYDADLVKTQRGEEVERLVPTEKGYKQIIKQLKGVLENQGRGMKELISECLILQDWEIC